MGGTEPLRPAFFVRVLRRNPWAARNPKKAVHTGWCSPLFLGSWWENEKQLPLLAVELERGPSDSPDVTCTYFSGLFVKFGDRVGQLVHNEERRSVTAKMK